MTLGFGPLGHPNIVKPLERIAGATIWSFVGGEPWNLALRTSGVFRCQARMIAAAHGAGNRSDGMCASKSCCITLNSLLKLKALLR